MLVILLLATYVIVIYLFSFCFLASYHDVVNKDYQYDIDLGVEAMSLQCLSLGLGLYVLESNTCS